MQKLIICLAVGVMCSVFSGCSDDKNNKRSEPFTPDAQAWSSEPNIPVSRTLVKNNIGGCGQMRWQPIPQWSSEFIVQCAPDGEYNVEYQVFTASEKVEGPYRPGGEY